MKHIFTAVLFLIAGISLSGGVIAVGDNPSALEIQAAKDLKENLSAISGANWEIVPEAQAKSPAIYLGQTEFAKKQIHGATYDKEEWQIQSVGKDLIITGGRPAGTFYGAMRLLQKCGVWFLTFDCTVRPAVSKNFVLPRCAERSKPVFRGRTVYDGKGLVMTDRQTRDAENLFGLRNFVNGGRYHRNRPIYCGDQLNLTNQYPLHHNFYDFVPMELFKTKPELFPMGNNGKRMRPLRKGYSTNLCLSNPETFDIVFAQLKKFIENDRRKLLAERCPVVYDFSQNDGTGFICRCPECKKTVAAEKGDSGLILRFVNRLATEINKIYPDIKIRTFAYDTSKTPPAITKPHPNVIVQLVLHGDIFKGINHTNNAEKKQLLDSWSRLCRNIQIWQYGNIKFFMPPIPEVLVDGIISDFRYYSQSGVTGIFYEYEFALNQGAQNFIELQHFLAYQLMVNPMRDPEELITLFINGYYGKGAPLVRQYFNELRKLAASGEQQNRKQFWKYLTPERVWHFYDLLKQAEKSAGSDSATARRIRTERLAILRVVLERSHTFLGIFQKNGKTYDVLKKEFQTQQQEFLAHYFSNGKIPAVLGKNVNKHLKELTLRLPMPEKFKHIPEENLRIFGYPHITGGSWEMFATLGSFLRDDPESLTGKCITNENQKLFETSKVREITVVNKKFTIDKIPSDGKYHWYCIPAVRLQPVSRLWTANWYIHFLLSSAYNPPIDYAKDNIWDVWVNIRYRGPFAIPGSTEKNSMSVDMIVLVPPGSVK